VIARWCCGISGPFLNETILSGNILPLSGNILPLSGNILPLKKHLIAKRSNLITEHRQKWSLL